MMLIELYCVVDDFCKIFLPQWEAKLIETGQRKRIKDGNMSVGEIMTINPPIKYPIIILK